VSEHTFEDSIEETRQVSEENNKPLKPSQNIYCAGCETLQNEIFKLAKKYGAVHAALEILTNSVEANNRIKYAYQLSIARSALDIGKL